MANYDIDVEYDELCRVDEKLSSIEKRIHNSLTDMINTVNSNNEYLSGQQYNKMRNTTDSYRKQAMSSINEIECTRDYIQELKAVIQEYSKCIY